MNHADVGHDAHPDRHPGQQLGLVPIEASVVALGGGHGLHASLSALRRFVVDLTAIVTVADNGGSSGRLRGEFGVLPPGDLRMALAALCGDDEWGQTWARLLQHRFAGSGELKGHSVGNLLIVGLWELLGSHVTALEWVGRLLGAHGRVLPMAITPMDINAEVRGADPAAPEEMSRVHGQVEVARAEGHLTGIELEPADPEPCLEAIEAVNAADWIVLGPGSWFTSVIPHLLVPDLHRAISHSDGRVIVVLNLEEQKGETAGYLPEDLLGALIHHAPELEVHAVLADHRAVPDPVLLEQLVVGLGARLVIADVAMDDGSARHDPEKLAAAYSRIMRDV